MKRSRKIQVLRQIQDALDRGELPSPLSVGLKEKEFQEMEGEELFEWYRTKDDTEDLSTFSIGRLSDVALGLIANAEPLPASRAARIGRVLGIGLWDLVKIPAAFLIGWYWKKYFP